MASIDRVVRVSISLRTQGVRQQTFSDIMLLREFSGSAARVTWITESDQLLDAPYSLPATDPLYKAAQTVFSQQPGPTRVAVGRRQAGEPVNTALAACAAVDPNWYGFSEVSHAVADAVPAAAWAEANTRLFGTAIAQASAITSATDDLATALKTGNFFHTFWFYHPDVEQFPELAAMAKAFQAYPGGGMQQTDPRQQWSSDLFSERTLSAVTTTAINESAYLIVKGKNGNTFEQFRNIAMTQVGITAGGEWIDVIRFRDWLCEEIRTSVFNTFINRKVPYTDVGIAIIRDAMVRALDLGVRRGGLAPESIDASDNIIPSYTVRVPREVEVSTSDKAARILRDVGFTARLSGAITATEIVGILTYDAL